MHTYVSICDKIFEWHFSDLATSLNTYGMLLVEFIKALPLYFVFENSKKKQGMSLLAL